MFEIGWSEMLVIAVVLIVIVGPKDLPKMLRTFGKTVAKLRGMAGDFQKQFNEALKEAELDDVKKSIDDIRGLNPANEIRKSINPFEKAAADVRAGLDKALRPDSAAVASPVAHPAEPLKTGPDFSLGESEPELSTSAPEGLVATDPPEPPSAVSHPAAPLKNGADHSASAPLASAATPSVAAAAASTPTPPPATPAPSAASPIPAPAAATAPAVGNAPAAKPAKAATAKTAAPAARPTASAKKPTASSAKPAAAKADASAKAVAAPVAAKASAKPKSAAGNGAKRQGSSK